MYKGKLIVIEGGDSSGKATQTALLCAALEDIGLPVVTLNFPRYNTNQVGALIRECLDGKHGDFMSIDARIASTLYAADRRETLPQIRQWLEEGKIIVLDRYTTANMIHQGAKHTDVGTRTNLLEWIHRLEHEIMNLPKPDLLLYLEIPARKRLELLSEQGRELDLAERDVKHQHGVDEVAADMLSFYPNAFLIDCMEGEKLLSREEIAGKVRQSVRDILAL